MFGQNTRIKCGLLNFFFFFNVFSYTLQFHQFNVYTKINKIIITLQMYILTGVFIL